MSEDRPMKLALVLDKRAAASELLAATWRAAAQLLAELPPTPREALCFLDFRDAAGQLHSPISALPLVVLRGKAADIRKALAAADGGDVHTVAVPGLDGDTFRAVLFFGAGADVDPLTRRFSLWTDRGASDDLR